MQSFARRPGFALNFARRAELVDRLRAADLGVVRIATRSATPPIFRRLALVFTRLGNGWIYPILCAVILLRWGLFGVRIIASALTSAVVLHSVYPLLKRRLTRERPFVVDKNLPCPVAPLDVYSFPSGHTMTMAGVFAPVVVFWPAALQASLLMVCGLAWSRLATAHHFPSDVLAGALMGVAVGYPVAIGVAWLW